MDGRRPRRGRAEARSRGDRARRACARRAGGRAPRFAALQPRVGAGRAARHRAHGRHAGVRRRRASSVEAAHMKLEDFLAQVPQGNLWVFGYGSLMWSPGFGYKQKRLARAYGYHRALCILSTRYRGTHRRPGLVVGLCRGGSCWRSEEHTSELQSHHDLVCRLLLEKKKKKTIKNTNKQNKY